MSVCWIGSEKKEKSGKIILHSKRTLAEVYVFRDPVPNRLLWATLPEKVYTAFCYVVKVIVETFHNYIIGQGLEAIILGSLCLWEWLFLQ